MFKFTKFIYTFSSYIIFIIALSVLPCKSYNCIHDQLTEPKITPTALTRSVKYQDIIESRDKNASLFEPLQIHFYIDKVEHSVPTNVFYNIERALEKIKKIVAQTFQVRKRKRPFVLERQGCTQRWQFGKNRGKCSKFSSKMEICAAKEIFRIIPDKFLDKLDVYDFEASQPRFAASSGSGLLDSNFITFITSQRSSLCEGTDVSAYGTFCRLDQKTNEPLAGIINICPVYFSKKVYPAQHYFNVILHELFHILGFSFDLFEKFLPCQKGIFCDMPKQLIQEDDTKTARMMLPLVIKNMQKHFDCSKSDFGGPMALKEQMDNSSEELMQSSHWHPILMYSSIMTPSFSEFDHIFVDNITLAVFGSTGWYRVNYSNVDNYKFGKGEGCDFGMNGSCDTSIYLCNPSENTSGCDLEHKSIGRCTSLTKTHPCGIYQAYTKENCESNEGKYFGLDFYSLGYKHKCFMHYEAESNFTPTCLPVKCKSNTTYDILINMTWYACHLSDMIIVENITYLCPDGFLLCSGAFTPTPRLFCPAEEFFFIAVRMYFKQPEFNDLSALKNFKNFKVNTLRGIADKIKIPVNYIVNASLSFFKNIFLDFAICPPPSLNISELHEIILNTQRFLDGKDFVHIMEGPDDIIISSGDIKIDPVDEITFSDHEGFKVLLAFPVMCGIFLLATFIASIARLFLIQRHRPRRVIENPVSDNIQLSEVSSPS